MDRQSGVSQSMLMTHISSREDVAISRKHTRAIELADEAVAETVDVVRPACNDAPYERVGYDVAAHVGLCE